VIAINALHDDVVPYGGGMSPVSLVARSQNAPFLPASESAARWAGWNGCGETPSRSQTGTIVTTRYQGCEADVVFVTLEEGGHGWPGGPTRRQGALPASDAVDATDLLWDFFSRHPAPAAQ
jgi:polyhydroxybutyrate depolymerase